MRSNDKLKTYVKSAYEDKWITVTALVWVWEAVFAVPAVLATLESAGGAFVGYIILILLAAGPLTYLLYRYFFRHVSYTIVNSDNLAARVLAIYARSLVGILAGALCLWLGAWLIDILTSWGPQLLRYVGAQLPQFDLRWHTKVLSTPMVWPFLVILSGVLPLYASPVWTLLIDDPHLSLTGAFQASFVLMRGHIKDMCRVLASFWLWLLAGVSVGIGLVMYAKRSLDFYFDLQLQPWMYSVGILIGIAPLVAYSWTVLIVFFGDLQADRQHREVIAKLEVPTAQLPPEPKHRSREQIEADLLDSMKRRQEGNNQESSAPKAADKRAAKSMLQMPLLQARPVAPMVSAERQQPASTDDNPAQPAVALKRESDVSAPRPTPAAAPASAPTPETPVDTQVSDYAAPVGEAMSGEMSMSDLF
ncbi:hypothetical protein IJJ08_04065 [bacterium]|nr:hypothetical protein [bacterium]